MLNTYYPNYQYQQPNSDERIWVQSETSADAYLVAPNGFVRLWDSNKPVFYEKRADASGRPLPLESYEYHKLEKPEAKDFNSELKAISDRLMEIERRLAHDEHEQPTADDAAI